MRRAVKPFGLSSTRRIATVEAGSDFIAGTVEDNRPVMQLSRVLHPVEIRANSVLDFERMRVDLIEKQGSLKLFCGELYSTARGAL
jgi:hypothetical protein